MIFKNMENWQMFSELLSIFPLYRTYLPKSTQYIPEQCTSSNQICTSKDITLVYLWMIKNPISFVSFRSKYSWINHFLVLSRKDIPVYSRSALHQILHQIEKYNLPQLNKKLLHIKESPKTLRYWCQFICLKW